MERRKFPALLLALTVAFAVFLAGMFLGRYTGRQSYYWEPDAETLAAVTYATAAAEETEDGGKLNINEASAEELAQLPGIGTVLAQRIVEYRTAYGPFLSLEELCGVDGIGEKRLEALRDYVTVR